MHSNNWKKWKQITVCHAIEAVINFGYSSMLRNKRWQQLKPMIETHSVDFYCFVFQSFSSILFHSHWVNIVLITKIHPNVYIFLLLHSTFNRKKSFQHIHTFWSLVKTKAWDFKHKHSLLIAFKWVSGGSPKMHNKICQISSMNIKTVSVFSRWLKWVIARNVTTLYSLRYYSLDGSI